MIAIEERGFSAYKSFMHAPNANYFSAELMVEELVRLGVRNVGIAPGSRSAPLAESFAGHPAVDAIIHPDERGLAYFMLGVARGSGRPAAIVTTSGTAATNLLPAIAEAHHAGIPLLALTADRPPELRDCGANQATDQVKLFGSFVKTFIELPPPDDRMDPGFVLSAVDEAVRAATTPPCGPVHVNCLFREPLAPIAQRYNRKQLVRALADWPTSGRPWTAAIARNNRADGGWDVDPIIKAISGQRQGIIVAGALAPEAAHEVAKLAERLQWPLLPDLQSGLRLGASAPPIVAHADLLLCSEAYRHDASSCALLQFGSALITRRFLDCSAVRGRPLRVWVDAAERRTDPSHGTAIRVVGDPTVIARALSEVVPKATESVRGQKWASASLRVERMLETRFQRGRTLTEPGLAWFLSRMIPADHAWFVGNSLPVRMAATFSSASGAFVRVFANRGLSGIDGQIATAAGVALGARRPLTALLGDLTLLHDLNSLGLIRRAGQPVVLVIVNNDGGGIFSLLPIAETSRHFERVFAAPHGLTFRHAAELFGIHYMCPDSPEAFRRAWSEALRRGEAALIEVRTSRSQTAQFVRTLQRSVSRID